jgi:hypothetical protein
VRVTPGASSATAVHVAEPSQLEGRLRRLDLEYDCMWTSCFKQTQGALRKLPRPLQSANRAANLHISPPFSWHLWSSQPPWALQQSKPTPVVTSEPSNARARREGLCLLLRQATLQSVPETLWQYFNLSAGLLHVTRADLMDPFVRFLFDFWTLQESFCTTARTCLPSPVQKI